MVVVVTTFVVVVVVEVDVGGDVVVVEVPLGGGGGSGTGELDVGELVVVVDGEVDVSDDDVEVSDDEVEVLVSDDVLVELVVAVSDPGATTTGSGIGGGGSPGGRVALASLASTLTVSSCH